MLSAETAALFLFVDWSEYARCGREIFKEAEVELTATSSNSSVSWWIVDISTADSPPNPALHGWLKTPEANRQCARVSEYCYGKRFCCLDEGWKSS